MIVSVIAHPNATTKPPLSFTADCLQPGQILFSIDEIEFRSTCWVICWAKIVQRKSRKGQEAARGGGGEEGGYWDCAESRKTC